MKNHRPLPFQCPAHLDPGSQHQRQELQAEAHELKSPSGITYPLVGGIPWLFPDPKATLADWRTRSRALLDQLENEIHDLKTVIKASSLSSLGRERLDSIRALKIRNLEMLKRTLEPLKPSTKVSGAISKSFGYRLPLRQGLLGYFPNLIRDWSRDYETENSALLEATLRILKKTKPVLPELEFRVLVVGAGASRLAYDLAHSFPKASVVAFDLNPVLLLAAKSMNDGKKLQAVDSSVSPKNPQTPGQAIELSAPAGPAHNLHFVFGDAYRLPFQEKSFDIVVTPWLVDILPRTWEALCTSIARVTASRGVWLNAGSWHFSFSNEVDNISLTEAEENAESVGWTPRHSELVEIPYLQSKWDAHRRFETMTMFCWERNDSPALKIPEIDDRESWIRDATKKVPALPAFANSSAEHAVKALVLSLVDGHRTLNDIAAVVSKEYGLSSDDALDVTKTFFDRFINDRHWR